MRALKRIFLPFKTGTADLHGELNPLGIRLLFLREIEQIWIYRSATRCNGGKTDARKKGETRRNSFFGEARFTAGKGMKGTWQIKVSKITRCLFRIFI